ncbi:prolyl hydroxylase family protein [Sphingomonas sp. MS122]|uniref:prolyl hydroxylase family protein n=1 Tax=Sphingomonas sp. MS122 TaxID=3412683 RepID=UPI003C30391F
MSLLNKLFGRSATAAPAPEPAPVRPVPPVAPLPPSAHAPTDRYASLPGSDPALLASIGATVAARLDADARAHRIKANGLDIFAVPAFVSPAECAELIALIDADVKPSTSLRADGKPSRRTSETCHLLAAVPLVAEVERRMSELLGLPLSHSETVQGQRYSPGQQFKVHNDYFAAGQPYSETVASEGGQRSWTAMVYLDAPASGGATRFPHAGIAIPPKPGVLLTWNNLDRGGMPNRFSHHEGMMVEAGIKHVLTKWFREREWHSSAASNALRR